MFAICKGLATTDCSYIGVECGNELPLSASISVDFNIFLRFGNIRFQFGMHDFRVCEGEKCEKCHVCNRQQCHDIVLQFGQCFGQCFQLSFLSVTSIVRQYPLISIYAMSSRPIESCMCVCVKFSLQNCCNCWSRLLVFSKFAFAHFFHSTNERILHMFLCEFLFRTFCVDGTLWQQ